VWDSVQRLGAQRIAHGVRSLEDARLVAELEARRVALDICPTSNVLTGAVPRLQDHPLRALHGAGVAVTVSSDDPLVFDTAVTSEVAILHRVLGFSWRDIAGMQAAAARHSFLPMEEREALAGRLRDAWRSVGGATEGERAGPERATT
jgi:adenosine deaminase